MPHPHPTEFRQRAVELANQRDEHGEVHRVQKTGSTPEGHDAPATLAGLVEGLERIPTGLLKSVTFDQGSEWAEWETITATYAIDVWFCDPRSPWQRGQIENQNHAWRWWFPRGTRLDNLDQAHVDHVASIINGQQRRNLSYHSPTELYHAHTVH